MKHQQIAIVDDDRGFAFALSHFLADRGYEVSTYSSGTEAIEALAGAHPSLAVVDANLPDMHGTEVINRIHATDPDLPVMMVTGDTRIANIDRCQRLDIDAIMLKPVNPDHFIDTVQSIVERHQAAQ